MSVIQISDIAKGIKLCVWIYEHAFTDEKSADVNIKNFRNDVHNLKRLLEKLDAAIQQAHDRVLFAKPALGQRPLDALDEEFERERKVIVGNFSETLKECQQFLEQRKQYLANRSNALENIRWHSLLHDEQRMNDLRQRVNFHISKIRFVLDRLSVEILTDLDSGIRDACGLAEENLMVTKDILYEVTEFRSDLFGYLGGRKSLPSISTDDQHVPTPAVALRFEESLCRGVPGGSTGNLPLAEGFDALLLAFEQSAEGPDQTPETYLALLKARWLMDQVGNSTGYQKARPGFYYRRACTQISTALKARLRSPRDIIRYDEEVLLALPPASFELWRTETSATIDNINGLDFEQDQARGNEVQIADVDLATDIPGATDKLTVFQKSRVQFRAVRKATSPSHAFHILEPLRIDVREDQMVPRYLLPTLKTPCLQLSVISRNDLHSYRFQNLQHLYQLQSAFTGFEVSHDQPSVTYQLSRGLQHLDCSGRVQLWQEPLESPNSPDAASPTSRESAALRSGSQTGTQISVAATNTVMQTDGGFEAQDIKRCAITMFSQLGEDIAIVFVDLPEDSYIDSRMCSCHSDYSACSKLVLTRRKKKAFNVRYRLCNFRTFDLLEFRINSSFEKAESGKSDYVLLKFRSLDEKNQFRREINNRFLVRNAQLSDRANFGAGFRQRQDQPQRHDRGGRQHSIVPPPAGPPPSLSMPSRAPQLPDVDIGEGSEFADAVIAGPSQPAVSRSTERRPGQRAAASFPSIADDDSAIDMWDPDKGHPAGDKSWQRSDTFTTVSQVTVNNLSPPGSHPSRSTPAAGSGKKAALGLKGKLKKAMRRSD